MLLPPYRCDSHGLNAHLYTKAVVRTFDAQAFLLLGGGVRGA